MAARIQEATGEPVELVRGGRGAFVVRVGDTVVATKSLDRGFPDDEACVAAVKEAL